MFLGIIVFGAQNKEFSSVWEDVVFLAVRIMFWEVEVRFSGLKILGGERLRFQK